MIVRGTGASSPKLFRRPSMLSIVALTAVILVAPTGGVGAPKTGKASDRGADKVTEGRSRVGSADINV